MVRAKWLFTGTLAALSGGIALLIAQAVVAATPAFVLRFQIASSALLVLASVGGLALVGWLRRDCQVLTRKLRQSDAAEKLALLEDRSLSFAFLQRAMTELAESTQRAVEEAAYKARELELQLKVATAERQHAEAIIYSISDAVLVSDAFGQLLLANESAARTFNFELSKSLRRPLDEVLGDAQVIDLIRQVGRAEGGSSRRVIEHAMTTPQGPRTYKVTLASVSGGSTPSASSAGVVAVLHDMTREKEVAEMKDDFVSMVSHELRTPLASIKAYVEMLIDGEARDAKTQREFYDVIQNEANRLGRLIDNILSIARIESGLVRVNRQPQSVAIIVKDALEVIAPQAKAKQIALSEKLPPIFYQTLADHDMLHQAVLNLLSNAVKYTPVGGSVSGEVEVDEVKKRLIVKIVDTGVGIPPKDLPFVFDKFYRAEANSRMASGTGLGLSLVKQIIETVHQGQMLVESQVGKGSSFGFELALCD